MRFTGVCAFVQVKVGPRSERDFLLAATRTKKEAKGGALGQPEFRKIRSGR